MNLWRFKRVRRLNLELNALEWEGNCYVRFRVRVSLTRQVLVRKIGKIKKKHKHDKNYWEEKETIHH
jgi:hypothetical protein